MKRLLLVALAVMVAVGVWSAAYGNEPSRVISGTAAGVTKVVGPSEAVYLYDFSTPPDGVNDYEIRTRLQVTKLTGVIEGMTSGPFTSTLDIPTNISRYSMVYTFWGRVGGSEPGVMTIIGTGFADRSKYYEPPVGPKPGGVVTLVRYTVVEGSGTGGLEGISGHGTVRGEGPSPAGPFVGTANWEFRFSNASGTAFLASP